MNQCEKCRGRGWVFKDILMGLTERCSCKDVGNVTAVVTHWGFRTEKEKVPVPQPVRPPFISNNIIKE